MMVLGSRIEAVRWQLAINKYIKSRGYKIGKLVAFSGEVSPGTITARRIDGDKACSPLHRGLFA